jgi:hypothetical protein
MNTCDLQETAYWEEFEHAFSDACFDGQLAQLLEYIGTRNMLNGQDAKTYLWTVPSKHHHIDFTAVSCEPIRGSRDVDGPFHKLWFVDGDLR